MYFSPGLVGRDVDARHDLLLGIINPLSGSFVNSVTESVCLSRASLKLVVDVSSPTLVRDLVSVTLDIRFLGKPLMARDLLAIRLSRLHVLLRDLHLGSNGVGAAASSLPAASHYAEYGSDCNSGRSKEVEIWQSRKTTRKLSGLLSVKSSQRES